MVLNAITEHPETALAKADAVLKVVFEAVVIALVCLSPWALGSVDPVPELYLFAGIAGLLCLWSMRMLLTWRATWKFCPVTLCLSGLLLVGVIQLIPVSRATLGWLAPGTANVYEQLLPSAREVVRPLKLDAGSQNVAIEDPVYGDQPGAIDSRQGSSGDTISLYPDATRNTLLRMLALFALFAAVRANLRSVDSLRRLAIALVINGAALSLFGLIQFFASDGTAIYGIYEAPWNATFGPFINKNHFAFYVNLCIGLGIGLLFLSSESGTDDGGYPTGLTTRLRELLSRPGALWIMSALAVMASSVFFCLSRGGALALLGATGACLWLSLMQVSHRRQAHLIVPCVIAVLALLVWFGWERVETRMATLWDGQAIGDPRVFLLTHSWQLFQQFPMWGTGLGTFELVEPLQLHTANDVGSSYEHAHNEYLEGMIEGGLISLALRLFMLAILVWYAVRVFRTSNHLAARAMALGLIFALVTIAIHSFFEFGLAIPAIAVLATVLCAAICSLNDMNENRAGDPRENTGATGRLDPIIGTIACSLVALFLCVQGVRLVSIEHLGLKADLYRSEAFDGRAARGAEIPVLEEIVSLNPLDADQRFLLAEAHLDVYQQIRRQLDRIGAGAEITGAEITGAEMAGEGEFGESHLRAGLEQTLLARDLCPLMPGPHARLAFYRESFASADSTEVYMDRVKRLAPADPRLWYFCGLQELSAGDRERTWESWRRSLELSDRYLQPIIDRTVTILSPDQILTTLLPDRPDIALGAATYLYPNPEARDQREPFLRKALSDLDHQPEKNKPEATRTKARVLAQLGRADDAINVYREALASDPTEASWRYELAVILQHQGRDKDLKRELQIILASHPRHTGALELKQKLETGFQ